MHKTIKSEENKILVLKILVLILLVIIGYLYYSNRVGLNQGDQFNTGNRVPVFHGPTGLSPSSLDQPVQEPIGGTSKPKGSTTPSTLNQPVNNSNISGGPAGSPSVNGPAGLPPGTLQ